MRQRFADGGSRLIEQGVARQHRARGNLAGAKAKPVARHHDFGRQIGHRHHFQRTVKGHPLNHLRHGISIRRGIGLRRRRWPGRLRPS